VNFTFDSFKYLKNSTILIENCNLKSLKKGIYEASVFDFTMKNVVIGDLNGQPILKIGAERLKKIQI